jgi:hypothetical protein
MFGNPRAPPPPAAAAPPPQSPSSSHDVEVAHVETASSKSDPQYDPRDDVIIPAPADIVGVSEDAGRDVGPAVVGRCVGAGLGGADGGSDVVGAALGASDVDGAYVGRDVGEYVGPAHDMSAKHMSPSGQSLPVLPK